MKRSSRKENLFGYRAQAIVEFAIALPILMALLVGILEVGRMLFIYSAVTNASREAVRYASAIGLDDSGSYNKYNYCAGIQERASRSAYFTPLTINISYDQGPGTAPYNTCDGSVDSGVVVSSGDRVVVTVTANYSPMLDLIPLAPRPITSSSARTILGVFNMTTGQGSVPTSGPVNTPAATLTSTSTALVPSDTPTATATDPSGQVITFTPLPSSTPTLTPTITPTATITFTPTNTLTPTLTFTPTVTSTPVPGCGNLIAGWITVPGTGGSKTMSMTITNPHDSITVLNVQVAWNSVTGASGNKTLTLKSVSLGTTFWTGSSTAGSGLTITPSTTVTIPGNNRTSTIVFTFDANYQYSSGNAITINLSTPGCESSPINGVNP